MSISTGRHLAVWGSGSKMSQVACLCLFRCNTYLCMQYVPTYAPYVHTQRSHGLGCPSVRAGATPPPLPSSIATPVFRRPRGWRFQGDVSRGYLRTEFAMALVSASSIHYRFGLVASSKVPFDSARAYRSGKAWYQVKGAGLTASTLSSSTGRVGAFPDITAYIYSICKYIRVHGMSLCQGWCQPGEAHGPPSFSAAYALDLPSSNLPDWSITR